MCLKLKRGEAYDRKDPLTRNVTFSSTCRVRTVTVVSPSINGLR